MKPTSGDNKIIRVIRSFFRSLKHAFNGLFYVIKTERNMRFHILLGIIVFAFGIKFDISYFEWTTILIFFGFTVVFEIFNTTIENIVDLLISEYNMNAKRAKDTSAACVLVFAILYAVALCMIFIDDFLELFKIIVNL
ncbi:diacylglycerol kinase family protein [Haloplasma contractile]|uniref:Diacylglycerol kinase protein n=1 Tax=Haloplasma contractile SSD-17B TaxID=1033810 RepID=U2EFX2_9MOLU|nr:diacylglycerol kinase family protein [Haloplasma contractile]ERJ13823.1 Diacylglycerol kinase protein [Haloplasma contractile SSD-17B]